jgi:predicted DCC family thiol-disulfide oxidoreductase YuxK
MKVAQRPGKPLIIFDGDCQFCRFWIQRWHAKTGDAVEYLPSQESSIARRFPEIPKDEYRKSVLLIEPDGTVYHGAEAACRSLAVKRKRRWLLWCYYRIPGVRRGSEWLYEVISEHRTGMAAINRVIFGKKAEQA